MLNSPQIENGQELAPQKRGALYVDGFNLYYPISDMALPYLKWLSLRRLGEHLCAPLKAKLVKTVFCTAMPENAPNKRQRHTTYNNALVATGVVVLKGHYIFDKDQHKFCEKQTDINLALSVITDAEDNVFDIAYLLSADSDQASTARFFKERHPQKMLISIAPPNKEPPTKMLPYVSNAITLQRDVLEASLFRGTVQGRSGLIVRPTEYDPPHDFIHPDDRPKKS